MDDDRFDFDPKAAPYSNLGTSMAAARFIEKFIVKGRKRIYGALFTEGRAADFQLHKITGLSENTVRPRRGELADAGLVRDSGHITQTPSGQAATLWEVNPEPSLDQFLAYMKELERRRSEIWANVEFENVLTPEGKKRTKKLKLRLNPDGLAALANALGGADDPLLFDLRDALVQAGFDPGSTTPDPSLFDFDLS